MIGIAIGLGGLVALIALAIKRESEKNASGAKTIDESTPKPFMKGLPEPVKHVVLRQVKGERPPTKTELEIAASSATMAGFDKLGEELSKKAEAAREVLVKTGKLASPIEGVSDDAWTNFTRQMKSANPEDIDAKGNVGMFAMTVRRLTDLGVFKDPKKVGGVWNANWQIPREKLLSNPKLQYKLFEKSMVGHVGLIKNKLDKGIAIEIGGKNATLSGLLAVAHRAGAEGMNKWIDDPNQRAKFPNTTAVYVAMNGIF